MKPELSQPWLLFLLALVFTVALSSASVEVPYMLDEALQGILKTPGGDSHSNPASRYGTELFISHYHLRLIGYVCFGLTVLLIVAGFATRKSGLAAVGAVAFMLPVFAQFASVMFFLAGLGILNLLWLPVLDISFDLQRLGLIIRAPYDLLMWLFWQAGINVYWPLVYFCIGGGLLVFFLGTFAWFSARARKSGVADFWIYRFSRHPQYFGWILWTYGLYLLLMLSRYPKRSWGIDASLPWLLSTMVIAGVAMLEELHMKRQFGDAYERYRAEVPFFFPLPAIITRVLSWPFRWFFGKDRPERAREVAIVLSLETALLIGASVLFYGGVTDKALALIRSEERERKSIEAVVRELRENPNARQKYFLGAKLAAFGEPAIPYLIALLKDENADIRSNAAERLRELPSPEAVPALIAALNDPTDDVRHGAIRALATIGAAEAREPILRLTTDANKVTQRYAARALADLKAPEVVDLLLAQLGDPLLWIRIGAAEDLGTLRSEKAVPFLIEQLRHENPHMRRAVAIALGRTGTPEAAEALRSVSLDDDWEVRLYATEGLKVINTLKTPSATNHRWPF